MRSNLESLLVLGLLLAGAQASASGRELCKGGYPVMLMTEGECRAYLATRHALEKNGDMAAVKLLDAHTQDQLAERAEACPCVETGSGKLALSQDDGC